MATELLDVADQADAASNKSEIVGQALGEILAEGLSPEIEPDSGQPTSCPQHAAISVKEITPTLWIPSTVMPVPPRRKRERQPGVAYQPTPRHFRVPRYESRSWYEYFLYAMFAAGLALSAYGLFHIADSERPVANREAVREVMNIEDARVGMRATGRNPLREQVDPQLPDPDPKTWRKLSLLMTKPSGHRLWIDLLRPEDWIAAVGAIEGQSFYLDLSEMGAVGEAQVLAIEACPEIRSGPGNVITGTFRHEADENTRILSIKFSDGAYLRGVTANHPFWSEDRGNFVAVGNLRKRERVRVERGFAEVVSVTERFATPGEMLYNLETHNEHVYQVTTAGILVHNACADDLRRAMNRAGVFGDIGTLPHHMVSRFDSRAALSRSILGKYKIDLDSHWNGVFLPGRGSTARGAIHNNLHSDAYYDALNRRLGQADRLGGHAGVLRELQRIRSDLLDGNFESLLNSNINF